MFKSLVSVFSKRNNKLEEELVEETIKLLGNLSDMKKQGKITEAVYRVEIEKKISALKSLNLTYERIINSVELKEVAASNERDNN
ncbi:MAG: hypothetical protein K0Q47_28 [Sedimentibacter sp.]|jgi:hypothetical protein|nr:hypothetical protein [Sedimentibacter sp.]